MGTRSGASTFIGSALEVMMSLNVDSLQDEVMSFLRAREELCEASLSATSLSHLLSVFDSVCRQASYENEATSSEDRQTICSLAADAIIALAKEGVHPKDIRRYALAHVLFMTKPSVTAHH
jgi:hypothetical protein